jgi:hypothetical protein
MRWFSGWLYAGLGSSLISGIRFLAIEVIVLEPVFDARNAIPP